MRVPSLTPAGILTLNRRVRRSRPEPRQFGHGSSMIVPLPRQRGHGDESANRPCDSAIDPAAAALRTDDRRRPRLRARAAADVAARLEAHRERRLDALERVLERQGDLDLDVRAPLAARLPGRPAAHAAAEQPAEQVAEVAELAEVERDALAARAEAHTAVRRAVVVVGLALLRVGEDVVGGLQLLEALLRLLVARVLVRVVLPGELAVRLLDLVGRRAPWRRRGSRRGS